MPVVFLSPGRSLGLFALTVLALASGSSLSLEAAEASTASNQPITFEQHVRPILKAYCLDCHGGGETPEGKLDLRLKRFIAAGGESGAAVQPGKPGDSLLLKRIKSGEMPPTEKKLSAEQIAIIEQWIAGGAATAREEPATLEPGLGITAEERAYWCFQPLRRPDVPLASQSQSQAGHPPAEREGYGLRSPVDAFVVAKLVANGLTLNDEADRFTMLKRATFDLIGLPPTPTDDDEFLTDASPDAYEKLIDRLLASPHYGERWGRHWLDVAGYADSEGDGSVDTVRPYIYKYRDYVIRSLNEDKPIDQFIIEQLAGDELVTPPYKNMTPEQIEKLVATGFLRMAADPTASGQGEADLSRNQVVADTIKIVSSSLLGLSVGCAQCHDHRYDPISQADYYRLRAIFEPALDWKAWRIPRERVISLYTDDDRAKAGLVDGDVAKLQAAYNEKRDKFVAEAFDKELDKHPAELRDKLREAFKTPADKQTEEQKKLVAENPSLKINPGVLYQYNAAAADELKKDDAVIQAKRAEKPVEDFVGLLNEPGGTAPATFVFHRGDHRQPKTQMRPADLTIAAPEGQRFEIGEDDPSLPSTGRRLAWARHLTNGQHPLFGRVLANRIWLNHFGRGIVDTPGEFGLLGTRPTHPELLDWMACEVFSPQSSVFSERQGASTSKSSTEYRTPKTEYISSLKRLHRRLMTSAVYRQTSRRGVADNAKDADGSLYSRFPVRRLEAEIVRDRALAVSGRLDRTPFGKPLEITEDFAGQVHVKNDVPRRSVYIQVRRSKPVSLLSAFDAPVMAVNCERRSSSTVAPQSLMLMNGDFLLAQADHLAKRLRAETPADLDQPLIETLAARFAGHAGAWQYGYGFVASHDNPVKAPLTPTDEGTRVRFAPLPHFAESSWGGGPSRPDPTLGWVILHAAGGHAGSDQEHAAIRRWTAPRHGVVSIAGKLKHSSENGDGVRGRIVSGRTGLVGQWEVKASEIATDVPKIEVGAGDTIDFLTDCRASVTSDSFEWSARLELADAAGVKLDSWDSAMDFHGPLGALLPQQIAFAWRLVYGRPATNDELELACRFVDEQTQTLRASNTKGDHELLALTSLCQQLLSSNEFLYVD